MQVNQKLLIMNNLKAIQMKKESVYVTKAALNAKGSELSEYNIGASTLQKLSDKGIVNLGQLKALGDEKLSAIITNPLALKSLKNLIEANQ